VFDQLAVDIDFANHRIAFRDPKTLAKPEGAIEIPIVKLAGERVVPVSVDGAAPAQFEFELGNMNGPLLVTAAFAQANQLLRGHPTSERLSGPFAETVVSVDLLGFAGTDFQHAPIAIIPDSQLPPAAIVGGVGLPLLQKFRLIVDYSHDRLYAMPDAAAIATPIAKDRIGLLLGVKGANFIVAFVAPGSPAALAGFKKGDEISAIDGKAHDAWPVPDIIKLQMTEVGTIYVFTMADGSTRRITAADFF
jgi:PDZ domain